MKNRKFISAMLIFALMIGISSVSSFAFATGPLKNQATKSCSTSISKNGAIVKVQATARGNTSVTKINIKMELQKKNGSSYSTVKTWSSTINSSYASMQKTAVVSSNATYRVKTTFTVYVGSSSESIRKIAY